MSAQERAAAIQASMAAAAAASTEAPFGGDAQSLDVCEAEAELRKEPRCVGKYDPVIGDTIEDGSAWCLKGVCMEGATMEGLVAQQVYRDSGYRQNPLRGLSPTATADDWYAAARAFWGDQSEDELSLIVDDDSFVAELEGLSLDSSLADDSSLAEMLQSLTLSDSG